MVEISSTHLWGDPLVRYRESQQQLRFLVQEVLGPRSPFREIRSVKAQGHSHLGSQWNQVDPDS